MGGETHEPAASQATEKTLWATGRVIPVSLPVECPEGHTWMSGEQGLFCPQCGADGEPVEVPRVTNEPGEPGAGCVGCELHVSTPTMHTCERRLVPAEVPAAPHPGLVLAPLLRQEVESLESHLAALRGQVESSERWLAALHQRERVASCQLRHLRGYLGADRGEGLTGHEAPGLPS
jgi:hypothetical protein